MQNDNRPLVPLTALSPTNPFIIAALLDTSGSMSGLKRDVIDGFNSFIGQQRKVATPTVLHAAKFDDEVYELHNGTPIQLVMPLQDHEYTPEHGGGTALFDALGGMLTALLAAYPGKRRGVVFVHTDGQEMNSHVYSEQDVSQLVAAAKTNGWDFVFIGVKAGSKGTSLDFSSTGSYSTTSAGVQASYGTISANLVAMRSRDITSKGFSWDAGASPDDPKAYGSGGRKFKRG